MPGNCDMVIERGLYIINRGTLGYDSPRTRLTSKKSIQTRALITHHSEV
jgi:hypothetical protein